MFLWTLGPKSLAVHWKQPCPLLTSSVATITAVKCEAVRVPGAICPRVCYSTLSALTALSFPFIASSLCFLFSSLNCGGWTSSPTESLFGFCIAALTLSL